MPSTRWSRGKIRAVCGDPFGHVGGFEGRDLQPLNKGLRDQPQVIGMALDKREDSGDTFPNARSQCLVDATLEFVQIEASAADCAAQAVRKALRQLPAVD